MKVGKVLLINLGFKHTPRQVLDAPLGLSYIGAHLKKYGHHVEAIDLSVEQGSLNEILQKFRMSYDIVGISFVTCTFNILPSICKIVKLTYPQCRIVVGGPHATFRAKEILLQIPYVDMVVIGEGEETLLEILTAKLDNDELSLIKGIAFKKGDKVFFSDRRPFILDVDRIPYPARELFNYRSYMQRHIITSRGCPFDCIFCISPSMWDRNVRFRSIYSVFKELENQLLTEHDKIFIADDIFTIKEDRVITFCELIQKHNLHFSWACLSRVDMLTENMVGTMAKSGCAEISLGCESGSSKILKKSNKKIEVDQILEAVSMLRSFNIKSRTSWIIGLPGEDETTVDETIDIMVKACPDTITIYSPIPYPGTQLAKNAAKFGMKILEDDVSQYWSGTPKPVMLPKNLTTEEYFTFLERIISSLKKLGYMHLTQRERYPKAIRDSKVVVTDFMPSMGLHSK